MTYVTMYDAVTTTNIPRDAEAVAGYVSGSYANYDRLVEEFPHAHHLSIATYSGATAQILDCEPGDATISECKGWIDAMLSKGIDRPGIYASMSYWEEGLTNILRPYGDKVRRWTAEWTFHEHVPTGFDACQWSGGQVLDISACVENFFGPPPPPPDPHHYKWFMNETFHIKAGPTNELDCVLKYDGARKRPVKYAHYLHRNLRPRLHELANRVWHYAHFDERGKKRDKPEWDAHFRGFRYHQLIERAHGKQIVK